MKHNRRPLLAAFYQGNRLRFALALSVGLMTISLNFGITWVLQQMVDAVWGHPDALKLSTLGLLTAGIILLIVLFKQISYHTEPEFLRRAMMQYKDTAFRSLTKKSVSAFRTEQMSGYLSGFSNDLNTIETDYLSANFKISGYVLEFCGALAMMLYYNPMMTVIATAFCLLPVLAAVFTGSRMEGAEKRVSEKNADFLGTLRDALGGFPVMKCFRAEREMAQIVARSSTLAEDAKCSRNKLATQLYMIGAVAAVTAQLGTFLVGCAMTRTGYAITPGELIAFIDLTALFIEAIRETPVIFGKRRAALALVDKMALALEQNVQEEGTDVPDVPRRAIEVSDLSFSYEPDKPVLRGICCTFEAGRSYAVVGASGCGKSTLLHLLMGSGGYEGKITFDGHELRGISSRSLFDSVSVIQQNVFVFNASIRDNITMFQPFAKEEVDRAIAQSGLSALIAERGEDSICGEGGSSLSGGEKQRISIARSLLRHSRVLLADEVTAALDAQTAYQVSDAILNLDGITRIVVTHNLDASLLRRYDRILTMKSGEIIEEGTFEQLMQRKGYFYSLYTVSQ